MTEQMNSQNGENLREAYRFAREERANADTLLWEVSAIIWGGQTLLLGFVLEAISGSRGALILVIIVAFTGIFMAFFNWRVTKKRSEVCNAMIGVMSEIEETLNMPIKPQAKISANYGKGSQTGWSNRFNLLFGVVWVFVMMVAIYKLSYNGLFYRESFYSERRFTRLGNSNVTTFIMFDQKTAQACWAGPSGQYTIESPEGKHQQETNGANLPFCKTLK
jgi:hypothetical protein